MCAPLHAARRYVVALSKLSYVRCCPKPRIFSSSYQVGVKDGAAHASPAKLYFNKSNALSLSSTNGQDGHYALAAFLFANRTPYAANGVYIKGAR